MSAMITFVVLAAILVSADGASSVLKAPTISYVNLMEPVNFEDSGSNDVLKRAMSEEGLVAIADIPGFAELRSEVLLGSYKCGKQASEARTTVFEDGTSRRTIAATATGVDKVNAMEFGTTTGDACSASFEARAEEFRMLISTTAKAFTQRLGDLFTTAQGEPLLRHFDGEASFDTMEAVVSNAEHLEHFHTYYKPTPAASDASSESPAGAASESTESTIDLHADQGIFIAFTPAILVEDGSDDGGEAKVASLEAGQFYVKLMDGSTVTMDFGDDGNVLVFMLGDGVDQYINNKLTRGPFLRSAPHGMVMPAHTEAQSRVWYGRMFLPPMDALSEAHGISFGQLRKKMIEDVHSGGGKGQGVGCSRMLQETEGLQCETNQMYCWMRCMDYTETASPDACAAQGQDVKCANQLGQIWVLADSHGDYNPTCSSETNDTNPVQPAEPIPDAPASCATADFAAYTGVDGYQNLKPLGFTGSAMLMWNVTNGTLQGRMVVKAVVGWMAFGPAATSMDSPHPGMNGAPIIMGINDPDTTVVGMGTMAPFIGTGVAEYVIDPAVSAFRHWADTSAVTQSVTDSSIDITECFSSMEFSTSAVGGVALALGDDEMNDLIWGYHTETFLKGYHGWTNKGKLTNFTFSPTAAFNDASPSAAAPAPLLVALCSLVLAALLHAQQ